MPTKKLMYLKIVFPPLLQPCINPYAQVIGVWWWVFVSRSAFGYFWQYSVCVSLKLWLKESESCRIQESVCCWPACVCGLMLYLVQREMCRNTSGFSTALVSELKVLSCLLIQIFMHLFCIITMAKMSQDRFSLTFWSVIIIFCAPQCGLDSIDPLKC